MSKPVSLVIVGAGGRGTSYAGYALKHPEQVKVVGVAEPQAYRRENLVRRHNIPAENVFGCWSELAKAPRLADAAIVATLDDLHAAPAIALANKGYHLLLEKPMAPNEADCARIVQAALDNDILFAVCHVLRYTAYTRALKALVDSGRIGEVISLQHLEPVGYWHQAHSFVRGSWRNETQSSCMLLAKSCHDIDWIRHIMGRRCVRVSSFGGCTHFATANRPAGAADRCLDCPAEVERQCPYSGVKIYLEPAQQGRTGWPVAVLVDQVSEASIAEALRSGPYGRCVYACDNDVVDHQVVNLEFEGGRSASFTMTGFTQMRGRQTRIFGTRGEIETDSDTIRVYDFLTEQTEVIDTRAADHSLLGGHGGGDYGLMSSFIAALADHDASKILSGPAETLETHRMVFAAERARRSGTVETL